MGGLEQEAWESLDPENRQKVIDKMIEKGILLFTAVADSGPLRAEILASGKSGGVGVEDIDLCAGCGRALDDEGSCGACGFWALAESFAPAGEVLVEDF